MVQCYKAAQAEGATPQAAQAEGAEEGQPSRDQQLARLDERVTDEFNSLHAAPSIGEHFAAAENPPAAARPSRAEQVRLMAARQEAGYEVMRQERLTAARTAPPAGSIRRMAVMRHSVRMDEQPGCTWPDIASRCEWPVACVLCAVYCTVWLYSWRHVVSTPSKLALPLSAALATPLSGCTYSCT